MGRIVAVAYKPKTGDEKTLESLVEKHVPILREQGLATDRRPIIMRSNDGTIVEIFEWDSADAIQKAHTNEVVQELWKEFSKVCDYIPLSNVAEVDGVFSEFEALN